MKQKMKLYSEENTKSEKNNNTSSNNFFKSKKNFFSKIRNRREFPTPNQQKENNKIKTKTKLMEKNDSQTKQKLKKSFSFTYNYFRLETKNKNKSLQDKSFGIKSIKENKTTRGNFISLSNEANKFTKNDTYIKNKRIQFYDINPENTNETFSFDGIKTNKNNKSILYKTTYFRVGKFLNNNNKEKKKKKLIRRIGRNLPIEDIVSYLEQNERSLNIFKRTPKKKKLIKSNSFKDNNNHHINNNSLYKEIMNKKEKILEALMNNQINEYEKFNKFNRNSSINYSELNSNNYSLENYTNYNSTINKSDNDLNKSKYSSILFKKEINNKPLIFPKILIFPLNHKSKGEKGHFIKDNFIRIKTLIENDKALGKNKEFDYIKEFLINNNIEEKYINSFNIMNFSKFLSLKEMPIDENKSLKENILLALNYNEDNGKKNNSGSIIINTSTQTKDFFKHKLIKKQGEVRRMPIYLKKRFNIKDNHKSLILDLIRQKRLYRTEEEKSDIKLNNDLKKEINEVQNEIINKQEKIIEIENKLNLIPFHFYYFNNKKKESRSNKKENPIELRLVSLQQQRSTILNNFKKVKEKNIQNNIFQSNERLYYSWFREKRKGDINNFLNRIKMTEFAVYNKTKEKILKDKFKQEFFSNKI